MASGTTIQLFLRTRPRFWQSSSLRTLKGPGAVSQFPVLRRSLMIFRVRTDSEAMSSSWRVIAGGRESIMTELVILCWVSGSVGLNKVCVSGCQQHLGCHVGKRCGICTRSTLDQ